MPRWLKKNDIHIVYYSRELRRPVTRHHSSRHHHRRVHLSGAHTVVSSIRRETSQNGNHHWRWFRSFLGSLRHHGMVELFRGRPCTASSSLLVYPSPLNQRRKRNDEGKTKLTDLPWFSSVPQLQLSFLLRASPLSSSSSSFFPILLSISPSKSSLSVFFSFLFFFETNSKPTMATFSSRFSYLSPSFLSFSL